MSSDPTAAAGDAGDEAAASKPSDPGGHIPYHGDSHEPDENTDELEAISAAYVEQLRRGESPSIEEYAASHPQLASDIRELFPMLQLMEKAGESDGDLTTPHLDASASSNEDIGEYRILRELGRGGMGVVYEAEHKLLHRRVALKILPAALVSSKKYKTRFYREARAAARLHHSNIVPVFDFGEDNGIPYYAMQFIDGMGIDEIILALRESRDSTVLPAQVRQFTDFLDDSDIRSSDNFSSSTARAARVYWRRIAQLGFQAADALQYAHQQGILHRDIKPSNLLVDDEQNVWITDFGLAKTNEDQDLTATGDFVGTLRYLAPEAINGSSEARSDLYGLGLVLYELVALQSAFTAKDRANLMKQVLSDGPQRLDRVRPNVPRDLCTIIHKAVERDVSSRYASARHLAADLRRFSNDEPIQARPIAWPGQVWRWAKRNRTVAALLTAVAMLFAVVFFGSLAFSVRLNGLVKALNLEKSNVSEERDRALRKLFDSHVAEARARRKSGQLGQRFQGLSSIRAAAELLPYLETNDEEIFKLRSEAIGCLGLADVQAQAEHWPDPPFNRYECDFSPDGCRVAYEDRSKGPCVTVASVADQKVLWEFSVESDPGPPKFSPCGRWLAFTSYASVAGQRTGDAYLEVYDVTTGEQLGSFPAATASFALSRSSFAMDEGRHIVIRSLPECRETNRLERRKRELVQLALSADGRRFASEGDFGGDLLVWELESNELIFRESFRTVVRDIELNETGTELASTADHRIKLWDVATGECRLTLPGHSSIVQKLAFSADGSTLISSGWGNNTRFWSTRNGESLLLASGTIGNRGYFTKDNQIALHRGREVRICRLATGRERRSVMLPQRRASHLAPMSMSIHPCGRLVAMASAFGIRLADIHTTREYEYVPTGISSRFGKSNVAFDPSGQRMLTSGPGGVYVWKMHEREAEDGGLHITMGPPQNLTELDANLPQTFVRADFDPTGRFVVIASGISQKEIRVFNLEEQATTAKFELPRGTYGMTIASDAELIAVGNHHGANVRFYDGHTGTLIKELESSMNARVSLSPDGQFAAITGNDSGRLVETRNWTTVFETKDEDVAWPTSFSRDSAIAMFALKAPVGTLLVETATGTKLALVPANEEAVPRDIPARWIADGDHLVTFGQFDELVGWRMSPVRQQLRSMGLDWGSEGTADQGGDFVSLDESSKISPRPLEVTIDMGERRREFVKAAFRASFLRSGLVFLETAEDMLHQKPTDLDWLVVRGEFHVAYFRDHSRALEDVEQALAAAPYDPQALWLRANLRRHQHDVVGMIRDLEQLVEVQPNHTAARLALIWAKTMWHNTSNDPAQLLALTEPWMESDSTLQPDAEAAREERQMGIAMAAFANKRWEDAERALQSFPNELVSKTEEDWADWPAARRSLPGQPRRWLLAAAILAAQDKPTDEALDKALSAIRSTTDYREDETQELWTLLRVCERQGIQTPQTFPTQIFESARATTLFPFCLAAAAVSNGGEVQIHFPTAAAEDDTEPLLVWKPPVGAPRLDINFDCPNSGDYEIRLRLRRSKLAGTFRFFVNEDAVTTFDGWHDGEAMEPKDVSLGSVRLDEGTNQVSAVLTGHNGSSFGQHLYMESIELLPVDNP